MVSRASTKHSRNIADSIQPIDATSCLHGTARSCEADLKSSHFAGIGRQTSYRKRFDATTIRDKEKRREAKALDAQITTESCLRPSGSRLKRRATLRRHRSCRNLSTASASKVPGTTLKRHQTDPAKLVKSHRSSERKSTGEPPRKPRRLQSDPAKIASLQGDGSKRIEKPHRHKSDNRPKPRRQQSMASRKSRSHEDSNSGLRENQVSPEKEESRTDAPSLEPLRRVMSSDRIDTSQSTWPIRSSKKPARLLSDLLQRIGRSESCRAFSQ